LAGSILRKRATDTYNFVPPRLKTVTTLPSEIRKPYSSSLHMPMLPRCSHSEWQKVFTIIF